MYIVHGYRDFLKVLVMYTYAPHFVDTSKSLTGTGSGDPRCQISNFDPFCIQVQNYGP